MTQQEVVLMDERERTCPIRLTPVAEADAALSEHYEAHDVTDTPEIELEDELRCSLMEGVMPVSEVRSFEEAGVLTYNRGVVVRLADGSEFQLTIVRSRQADDDR
jgi:hypothetical protein